MDQRNNTFDGKTILVFGGHGFIGSNFIRKIIAETSAKVICFDKGTYSGNPANLDDVRQQNTGRLLEIKGDVADFRMVSAAFSDFTPDYVINFAAETHVDRSIHVGSMEFINTNVTGVYHILECLKGAKQVLKFVEVSTDEVYGMLPNPHDTEFYQDEKLEMYKSADMKFNRQSPFKPNVPYSATKAAGDCLCNAYRHTWHLPVVVTHCSNNYGPYQYPEKLVPFWVSRIMQGKKIPIYGDGLNVRDWIHVDDHIDALMLVLLNGDPAKDYLIGADNERTNLDMAKMIVEAVGLEYSEEKHCEFVSDRPGHDRRYAIDHSDITRELGWTPKYGATEFGRKLGETIAWYLDHKGWVEEVITRTGVANPHIDLWKAHEKN